MTILITGAAGFIGSHLADRLVQDYSTVCLDNFSTGRNENVADFFDAGGVIEVADITDRETVFRIFDEYRPERVIHLAAQPAISLSMEDPLTDLKINAAGTINLLHASQIFKVKKFVFASTSAVYREEGSPRKIRESWDRYPTSPYGASKMVAEMYVRQMFFNSIILRFGNVYGPRQVPIGKNQLIARAMDYLTNRHEKVDFEVNGSGDQTRDFIYVQDLVDIISRCALSGNVRATFNASSGKEKSVNQVLTEIEKLFGIVGYQWEHTKKEDPRQHVCLDISYIKERMSWKPKWNLKNGLKETAEWWLERNGR